MEFGINNNKEN